MNLDYINKLNIIIKKLIYTNNKNPFPQASYWKLGTSIFGMFDKFLNKTKNININNHIIECKKIKNENRYNLWMGENIVTPSRNKENVALSTITQYRRVFCSFGVGIEQKKYKSEKDFVINQGKIYLVHNFKSLIDKENRNFLIIKLISDSLFSHIVYLRDFSYSIIFEFLFDKNFDFSLLDLENRTFYFNKMIGKHNNKTKKCLSLIYNLQEIKNDIKKQGTNGTYKEIVECLNKNFSNVEDFVKTIWNEYESKENGKEKDDESLNNINKINLISEIKNNRSKFKNNIFLNRKSLNLIKNENDLYSDIEDVNGGKQGLLARFNEAEAAHIYDVWKIKNILLESMSIDKDEKNELLAYIANPNNGIIMKSEYHKSFDRGQWTFDINGNMLVHIDNQKYLFDVLGLKQIRIDKQILNAEMKEFLSKR